MNTPEQYRAAGKALYDALRLYTLPVAVKYIKHGETVPDGFMRPSSMDQKWSLCQAFTHARRWGQPVAMTGADNFCLASSAAHRFIHVEPQDLVQSQVLNLWHKDLDAELKIAMHYKDLAEPENAAKMTDHAGMLVAPLTEADFVPDAVLVYGNPGQMTHMIQALAYEGEHITRSGFIGFAESCIKGALLPYLTGKPQYVSPGAGDRAFSGTTEDEVAMGLPGELVFYVMENLFKTGGPFNTGCPIKTILPGQLTAEMLPGWVHLRERMEEKGGDKDS